MKASIAISVMTMLTAAPIVNAGGLALNNSYGIDTPNHWKLGALENDPESLEQITEYIDKEFNTKEFKFNLDMLKVRLRLGERPWNPSDKREDTLK